MSTKTSMTSLVARVVLALALVLPAGLAGADDAPEAGKVARPKTTTVTEKGDVNGDGKGDVWNYYEETSDPADPGKPICILKKKEADLNFDGRKDITLTYDPDGTLVLEEADLDFDGKVDEDVVYKKGILVEKHVYQTGGDRIFIWKYYEEGKLARLERDENDDGKSDYCELWYLGEKLSKKGWDKDRDGKCDYWENAH